VTEVADSRHSDIDFLGGKEALRLVLHDICISYGKFHVVMELKITNPKFVSINGSQI
jgi:hypothetical protein